MSTDLAIDLRHVAKTYRGKVHALRGVDMRVARGEVFGLLGPNGAGKSTLVKILMTVIRPSKCEGTVLGARVGHKPTLARVGYLPEHHQFPGYLTGAQVVDHYGAMCRIDRSTRKKRIGQLLDLVGMTDWADKRLRSYSKGMRQRVGIAQALINNPDLVLLDEPTDGVDPVGRRDIRAILAHLKDEDRTVFINSHLLSELEMVCDRVAILVQGLVRSQGTIDELTADRRSYTIALAESPDRAASLFEHVVPRPPETGRARLESGEWYELEGETLRIGTDDPARIQPMLAKLVAKGAPIREVRPHRPSLEDLFMEAIVDPETGQTLRPGAAANTPGGAQ
jgi:ABC-2 type transport system ATP-binding protein